MDEEHRMCHAEDKVKDKDKVVPRQRWKRSTGCAALKLKLKKKIKLCHDKGGRGA